MPTKRDGSAIHTAVAPIMADASLVADDEEIDRFPALGFVKLDITE
jgi:hypothetical protein